MRVIRELSAWMEVAGVLVHSAQSREKMDSEYPGKTYTNLEEFLQQDYTFVMVMVPGREALHYNAALMERGIPCGKDLYYLMRRKFYYEMAQRI